MEILFFYLCLSNRGVNMRLNRMVKAECDIVLYLNNISRLIRDCELEAMYPTKEDDHNSDIRAIGKNSDVVFNSVNAKNSPIIKNLKKVQQVVGDEFDCLSTENQAVIAMIYSNVDSEVNGRKSDKYVAKELGINVKYVKRIRKKFVNKIADLMGYY